jgi:hypothetical protein
MTHRFLKLLTASAVLLASPGLSVGATDSCRSGPCSKPVKVAFLQVSKCGTDDKPAKAGKKCSANGICNGINSDCCAKNDSDCLAGKR